MFNCFPTKKNSSPKKINSSPTIISNSKYLRCFVCNKKLLKAIAPLIGLCKCEKIFCHKHILPKNHNCTFDHKSKQREEMKKNMPVIVSDKVPNRI